MKSSVKWCKIKEQEDESEEAKLLNNFLSGERQVWIELEKPIPSYGIIDGKRSKSTMLDKREPVLDAKRILTLVWGRPMLDFVMKMVV